MSQTRKKLLVDPLVDNNPITLQVLGICSALAVTSSLKVAFVIGSEDKGLKRLTALNCNKLVKINMPGKIESLNTSVSAGVLLFEYLRRNNSAN